MFTLLIVSLQAISIVIKWLAEFRHSAWSSPGKRADDNEHEQPGCLTRWASSIVENDERSLNRMKCIQMVFGEHKRFIWSSKMERKILEEIASRCLSVWISIWNLRTQIFYFNCRLVLFTMILLPCKPFLRLSTGFNLTLYPTLYMICNRVWRRCSWTVQLS